MDSERLENLEGGFKVSLDCLFITSIRGAEAVPLDHDDSSVRPCVHREFDERNVNGRVVLLHPLHQRERASRRGKRLTELMEEWLSERPNA